MKSQETKLEETIHLAKVLDRKHQILLQIDDNQIPDRIVPIPNVPQVKVMKNVVFWLNFFKANIYQLKP